VKDEPAKTFEEGKIPSHSARFTGRRSPAVYSLPENPPCGF
jgi:hypothetical protein